MPFRHLPPELRKHPDVLDARVTRLEQQKDTSSPAEGATGIPRYALLLLTAGVLSGKLTVEQAQQILGLLLGGGR